MNMHKWLQLSSMKGQRQQTIKWIFNHRYSGSIIYSNNKSPQRQSQCTMSHYYWHCINQVVLAVRVVNGSKRKPYACHVIIFKGNEGNGFLQSRLCESHTTRASQFSVMIQSIIEMTTMIVACGSRLDFFSSFRARNASWAREAKTGIPHLCYTV